MDYQIGDIIRIIDCPDARENNGLTGTVQYIEDNEFLYGTWSDEVICPSDDCDLIEKIGHEPVSRKITRLAEMSSKQKDAKKAFSGLIRQGIIHLIKLYCYRNWEQIYSYKWADAWIATVYRNIATGNGENDKSYIREADYDAVVQECLGNKFDSLFRKAREEVLRHDYLLPISDKDSEGSEKFVREYLAWAKPRLLQKEQIDYDEVSAKIYDMLRKVE